MIFNDFQCKVIMGGGDFGSLNAARMGKTAREPEMLKKKAS